MADREPLMQVMAEEIDNAFRLSVGGALTADELESVTAIAVEKVLANPDVVLRALGADFGSDVQDGDTRYLTVHFQWENS